MKRAELEKHLGNKVVERMRRERTPDRYGTASASASDRRAQRDRERDLGLVPFAVKLPQDLVAALQARAQANGQSLADVTAGLLRGALDSAD